MAKSLTVLSPYASKYLYPTGWNGKITKSGLIQLIPGPHPAKYSIYAEDGVFHYIALVIFLNTLLYLFK